LSRFCGGAERSGRCLASWEGRVKGAWSANNPPPSKNILWALGTFGLIDGSTVSGLTCQPLPEPASWAMMLLGFGFIGSAIRRRRPLAAQSFAPATPVDPRR